MGAFYPFARNHNAIGQIDQEPYRFSEEIQANMKNALKWRYALLRYYYTQLYLNSIEGGMFWKPLFFEFPDDSKVYQDIDKNIMIGPALKLSAMLDEKNDRSQKFIFPSGIWCDIITEICMKQYSTGLVRLSTTPDIVNIHLREGQILPIQPETTNNVMSSSDLDQIQTTLYSK